MAITNASRLADFGTAVGPEGAIIQVDNPNERIGIGTTNPQAMLQVGTAVTVYGNSGIVSATSFIGNLTGDVTGDVTGDASGSSGSCTGNAATATLATNASGLSGSPNITINNLVGVAATFSGVVTYEDVTNVDSLGIVTARGGIEFGAAGVGGTITAVGNAEFVGITTARGGFEIGAAGVGGTITAVGNAEFAGVTTSKGNLNVGSAITAYAATGIVSATAFYGDGAALSGVVSGIEVKSGGSSVGTSLTALNFSGATVTTASSGITTITISAGGGISTAAGTSAGIVTTLYLSDAQDHKMTASGITTITCSGGSEGESHTVRITNSGITTVGFSTYFLWPSGSAPSIPTTSGTISLISFTVQRVGTAGTQLLAGASLNFS